MACISEVGKNEQQSILSSETDQVMKTLLETIYCCLAGEL
jgi:hypothetical protein